MPWSQGPWARLVATALSRHPELIHGRNGPKTRLGGRKACRIITQTSLGWTSPGSTWTDTGCATASRGGSRTTGAGVRALVRWAGPEVVGVVYEATSSYHRDLEAAPFKAELPALRVNPGRAREFARASGMLAKTDKVDAMMLACMGAALPIEPARELSPARRELREPTSLRDALVGERKGAVQRARHLRHAHARRAAARHIRHLRREVASLDGRIDKLMASDEELDRQRRVLTSVKGIGPVISAVLLSHMPELGTLDAKSAASLAGVAPMACDSGNRRGRRRIQGGRGIVRRTLLMGAWSASQRNPTSRRSTSGSCRPGSPGRWRRWPWCASW